MPITKDHWLYQYMDDRDGDGSGIIPIKFSFDILR